MTIEILAIAPMLKICLPALEAAYTVHTLWDADDPDALIAEVAPRVRGIATDGAYGVSADVLARCPKVEVVACFGVGYDAVATDYCCEHGIPVTNTPEVLNDGVAEMTQALMLALARQIPQADQYVRAGRWVTDGLYPLTAELNGRSVGILGLGRIGKEIAQRCQSMRMRVVYHGRTEQPNQPYKYYGDLEAMARDVDWLVIIAPGTPETRGIVSRKVLQALGPEGRLVSIARGSLVDQEALIEMLQTGGIAGAALDVFLDEPNVPEALFGLDNVVLSPHQGSATHQTRAAMGNLVVRNLAAHFAGTPLITPVV